MRLLKGAHLENNQSDINNCFNSRYVFHANVLHKYYDYYSKDFKKELSSFQGTSDRIDSVLMKYIHSRKKIICRFFHFC